MNSDCLFAIAQFAGPKQAMQMTSEYARKFLPTSITINGHKQLEEFYAWAQHFDTSNLTEVRIVIRDDKLIESLREDYPKAVRADGVVVAAPIGLVPPSVKKLTLCVWTDEVIQVSETVEELVVEHMGYYQGLSFPRGLPSGLSSIRSLHLTRGFSGVVYQWPENLETLCMNGWCSGNGRWPIPIDHLPDTVKHLTLGAHLDVEIMRLPESLETLVIDGEPERFGWSLEGLGVPDWVEVTVKPSHEEEEDDDVYEDPRVEFWNL